jgi:hypothetical protein
LVSSDPIFIDNLNSLSEIEIKIKN